MPIFLLVLAISTLSLSLFVVIGCFKGNKTALKIDSIVHKVNYKQLDKNIKIVGIALFVVICIGATIMNYSNSDDDYYGSSQHVRDCYDAGYCKTVWK